jgi:hypothetical protein
MTRARPAAAVALLVLGGLVVALADVAVWARALVLDRDGFVTALRPLARDEDVLDGLVVELTDRVLTVHPGVEDALLRELVADTLHDVVRSPTFATLWTDAARLAHDQLVRLVRTGGHRVELDHGPALTEADALLTGDGHDLLSPAQVERIDDIVVTRSHQLARVVDTIDLVERLALVLPVVAVALLAGAVLLARRRARAIGIVGGAVVAAALATLAVLVGARQAALGRVDRGPRRGAAADVWDGVLDPLRHQTWGLLVVGAVLAGAVWLAARAFPVPAGRTPRHENATLRG